MWRRLPRVPVTVAYAAVLVVVTVGLATLGPAVHAASVFAFCRIMPR